jgi:DnaK suppressor protein
MASPKSSARQALAAAQDSAVEDQAPILHEQFVALSRHSRDRRTLARIEAALRRLDQGEYGICEDCEGEISLKRLQAIPWASRCVPCQERIEFHDREGLGLTA